MRTEDTKGLDGNMLETRSLNLVADKNGALPVAILNGREMAVLDTETGRGNLLAWYRNPSRASADALAWQDGNGKWRGMCPNFIFFHGEENNVQPSIVDPHGIHFIDALPKLRGLAGFAETYCDAFHRVEAVAKLDGQLRMLDLKEDRIRKAIEDTQDPEQLFRSDTAANY